MATMSTIHACFMVLSCLKLIHVIWTVLAYTNTYIFIKSPSDFTKFEQKLPCILWSKYFFSPINIHIFHFWFV